MGAAGLKGPSMAAAFARQRLIVVPRSTRSISTFRPQSLRIPSRAGQSLLSSAQGVPWRTAASAAGPAAVRFNSSMPDTRLAPTPQTTDPASNEASSFPEAPDLSDFDISSIPEHIGYLKELGLNYGWGPSSIVQWVIEHIHIWTGVPWWAAIVGTGLVIRAALLKPMIDASDMQARTQNIKHLTKPMREKYMQASAQGDPIEAQLQRAKISELHREHGIQMFKSALPMLQIPFGFAMFRVVRGMTNLPVPAIMDESVLWLKDMTIADPLFLLPAITSLCIYQTMKKGGETGGLEIFNTPFGQKFLVGLPVVSFAVSGFMPAALQLYFLSSAAWALGQSYVVHNDSFRRWAGLTIFKKPVDPSGPDSGGSKSLQALQKRIAEEQQKYADIVAGKNHPEQSSGNISAIDRFVNQGKKAFGDMASTASEKMKEMQGEQTKNADGSKKAPPRLSDKERQRAIRYENERDGLDNYAREQRNQRRLQAQANKIAKQKKGAK